MGQTTGTVTVEQAAAELGIGRTLAYQLAREGSLPALRLGRKLLIPRKALDELLTQGNVRTAGAAALGS